MDKNLLVIIRRVVDDIIIQKGEIKLFMLIPDQDDTGTYTIHISAKWLDDMSLRGGITMIADFLLKELGVNFLSIISRITAIRTNDLSVIAITNTLACTNSILTVNNCTFGGVHIPSAVIFEAKKVG